MEALSTRLKKHAESLGYRVFMDSDKWLQCKHPSGQTVDFRQCCGDQSPEGRFLVVVGGVSGLKMRQQVPATGAPVTKAETLLADLASRASSPVSGANRLDALSGNRPAAPNAGPTSA